MRLADVHDLFRRAGADEFVHHLAGVELRILDLAVELAVGEQTGTAFAELHVGFRRQGLLAPQRPGVLGAAAHILAALQHDGLEAHLCQQQRGEQPTGAEAYHQRPLGQIRWSLTDRVVAGIRRRAHVVVVGKARQDCRLVTNLDVEDVDEQDDAVLLARIVAALEHAEVQQVGVTDVQTLDDGLAQLIGGMIEGRDSSVMRIMAVILAGDSGRGSNERGREARIVPAASTPVRRRLRGSPGRCCARRPRPGIIGL